MQTTTQRVPLSKKRLWTGRFISALPVMLLLFSGVMKIMKPPSVVLAFTQYGYPESLLLILGIIEILCAIVYAIPRVSIFGAILLTAYLGGATATNVRVGNPSYFMTIFLGVLVWVGLYLRDDRLSELVPLRS